MFGADEVYADDGGVTSNLNPDVWMADVGPQRYVADPLETHFGRTLPTQVIRQYARVAAWEATAERLEDATWFATIPGFRGIWATGDSEEEALKEVEGVVVEWACLKFVNGDGDLPIVAGIDLNFRREV